jgi:hypothetical protein
VKQIASFVLLNSNPDNFHNDKYLELHKIQKIMIHTKKKPQIKFSQWQPFVEVENFKIL